MYRYLTELPTLWHWLLDSQKAKFVQTAILVDHILTRMPCIHKFSVKMFAVMGRGGGGGQ